jgi:hypothetical protein
MLDQTLTLPEDPEELRSFTARLLAEVKAQAILIEKLRHQLAGTGRTGSGPRPRRPSSCNWPSRPARSPPPR